MLIIFALKLENHALIHEIMKWKLCISYFTLHTLLHGLNLPVTWVTFSLRGRLALTRLKSNQTHQTLCWCPVSWTDYGRACSLYGNLCLIILWSFLHAVVLNMQHNGSYVAMVRCVHLHDIKFPICMFNHHFWSCFSRKENSFWVYCQAWNSLFTGSKRHREHSLNSFKGHRFLTPQYTISYSVVL